MRFYKNQHEYYCGIDLHANKMYVCVVNYLGNKVLHRNIDTDREEFLKLIEPYKGKVAVGVECMFCWYWLADVCNEEKIPFVLGHCLYMKALSGGKVQNDRIDSERIALLLKSGMFPESYVYPKEMRATRDLMRRRSFFVRKRAELIAHIQMTYQQYNIKKDNSKNLTYSKNRVGLSDAFEEKSVQHIIDSECRLIQQYQDEILALESHIKKATAKNSNNALNLSLLQTIPGVGDVLGLTLLYEIQDINRFDTVQKFSSYSRLIKPEKTSAGKPKGSGGGKIGNLHLKWAFSEATTLALRNSELAVRFHNKMKKKHSKAKALSILSHKLGRTVYFMLTKQRAFDEKKFLSN